MVDIAQSLIASGSFSNDDEKRRNSKKNSANEEESSQRLALSSTLHKQKGTSTSWAPAELKTDLVSVLLHQHVPY